MPQYQPNNPFQGNDYNSYGPGCSQPSYGQGGNNMYQQQMYPQTMPYQRPRSNGMGVGGFVLSILAWISCWIPVVNIIFWLLGLIFSFIGIFKAPRGLAIAGLVISLVSVIAVVFVIVVFGAAMMASMV